MNNSALLVIEEKNLSYAWAKVFKPIIKNSGSEISPLVISLTGFNNGLPEENIDIRTELDNSLSANGEQKVHTVANTIFPMSLWRLSKHDRTKFFKMYLNALPRYKALEKSKNKRGLYFERLIDFNSEDIHGNQLEHIITEYNLRKGVRRSMLQASIFDPARDHIHDPYLPFPCLQHVSFAPQNGSLTLNAFYATQQIYKKAYGNYLGLCRLGNFMAHEMNLTFNRMNCFIGVVKLDSKYSKKSVVQLEESIAKIMKNRAED